MGANIRLLSGVSPGMMFNIASGKENFVTLLTSIVLLTGVNLDVCLQTN